MLIILFTQFVHNLLISHFALLLLFVCRLGGNVTVGDTRCWSRDGVDNGASIHLHNNNEKVEQAG